MSEELKSKFDYEAMKKRNEPYVKIARRYETGQIGFYDALFEAHNLPKADEWVSVAEMPEVGTIVLGALQHWNTKHYRYYELKRVNEGDCNWRTVDDNSEVSYDWSVTHYKLLTPPNQ